MYVPPFDALLNRLGAGSVALDGAGRVTIPTQLLKLLLQLALAANDFDEEAYLAANPDVRHAVERGEVESARLHYIGYGYFEGRKGGGAPVDAEWYLKRYPDVAAAIAQGHVASAHQHFDVVGAAEGRSPSADKEEAAVQWKLALTAA
jgi:hypothetical protein